MSTVHLIIKGKVQGVFFRATAKEIAVEKQITGWVKNTRAGDVEILASGSKENIAAFIEWCRKGPEDAIVKDIIVEDAEERSFEKFLITRD
jgi:acylphosphatase